MQTLEIYERRRSTLYRHYREGRLTLDEYLRRVLPLDRWIDRIETEMIPGTPLWGKEGASPSRWKED